jgi:hypothetical protein
MKYERTDGKLVAEEIHIVQAPRITAKSQDS